MGRKNSISFARNANKRMILAEKEIASCVIFYDEEELNVFFKNFIESVKQSDMQISKNMSIFIKAMQSIYNDFPDMLNSQEKESFYPEVIINKILEYAETEIFSEKERENFNKWTDEVIEIANDESDNSVFIEGDNACYFFYWNAFLDKVGHMNDSNKDYRAKLESIKMPEVHNSIERSRVKMSSIKDTTFERSEYTTGISAIDDYVNLLPKNLMYVVARPSVGKSMFVVNLALNNALNGIPCLYISLEMSPAQTKSRILTWVKDGDVEVEDIPDIENSETFKKIDENFDMIDSETSNGEIILSYIDTFFKEYPNGIAILDSVNLVRFSGEDEWASLRHISKSLKEVARKRDGIIVCCAQASRNSDVTGISMDSLFGSSTLEQDTDIIIGLEPTNKDPNITSLKAKIVKNRDGMKDIDLDIKIKKATMHFYDCYS